MADRKSLQLPLISIALAVSGLAFAQAPGSQPYGWDCPGPWHMWGAGWGLWWIFPLFMFLMFAVILVLFLRRAGSASAHSRGVPWGTARAWGDPTHSALQILSERFAKGEIQKQEYEEKKTAILSSGAR